MTADLISTVSGRTAIIRFNRPDKKNAITAAMYAAGAEALIAADQDPKIRVVVISGEGGNFTSGNDLKDFLMNPPKDYDAPVWRFMRALSELKKPVIAAVEGVAVGIGTTLLNHCDLAFAGESAKFSMPFVNLGLVPEFAVSLLLPVNAGHKKAAEMIMLGEPFDAEKAKACGLLNSVVADGSAEAVALTVAERLAAKPASAIRQTKALLKREPEPVADRIKVEGDIFGAALLSPEAREAFTAFMEKRAPDFSQFD